MDASYNDDDFVGNSRSIEDDVNYQHVNNTNHSKGHRESNSYDSASFNNEQDYSELMNEYVNNDNNNKGRRDPNESAASYDTPYSSKPPSGRIMSAKREESNKISNDRRTGRLDSFPQLDIDFDQIRELRAKQSQEQTKESEFATHKKEIIQDDNSNPYAKPLHKEVLKAGNVSMCHSQARLYGLELSEDGKVKFPDHASKNNGIDKSQQIKTQQFLAQPNPKNIFSPEKGFKDSYLDEELDETKKEIQKHKSKAMKAMQNPRCGYDFVDRLNDRGDIVARLANTSIDKNGESSGVSKAIKDALEKDYDAKQNKLSCPNCKREQTFDEFYEKKRFCSQCNERFEQLLKCNTNNFASRMSAAQKKKEDKLKEKQEELYGTVGLTKAQQARMGYHSGSNPPTSVTDGSSVGKANPNMVKKSIRTSSISSSGGDNDNNSVRSKNSKNADINIVKEKYKSLESIQKQVQDQSDAIQEFNMKGAISSNSSASSSRQQLASTSRPSSGSATKRNNFSKTAPAKSIAKNYNSSISSAGSGANEDYEYHSKSQSYDDNDRIRSEKFQKLLD